MHLRFICFYLGFILNLGVVLSLVTVRSRVDHQVNESLVTVRSRVDHQINQSLVTMRSCVDRQVNQSLVTVRSLKQFLLKVMVIYNRVTTGALRSTIYKRLHNTH